MKMCKSAFYICGGGAGGVCLYGGGAGDLRKVNYIFHQTSQLIYTTHHHWDLTTTSD